MSRKVMIVDHSNVVRQSLVFILERAGYEVVEATCGMNALCLMKKHSIGLFISDTNMPGMDGITFLKRIKEDKDNKYIPVIMHISEKNNDSLYGLNGSEARTWNIKPFRPEQLLAAVKLLFVA